MMVVSILCMCVVGLRDYPMRIKWFVTEHQSLGFIVPLPRKTNTPLLGEVKISAVRRYLSLERSWVLKGSPKNSILLWRNTWNSVMLNWSLLPIYRNQIMKYFTCQCTSYWRSRAQRRMCVLCLAHLLNPHPESLLMILYWLGLLYSYSSLGDVLLRFRHHQYKLTTDVSKMYRAIKLTPKWSILSSFCLEKESHRTSDGL